MHMFMAECVPCYVYTYVSMYVSTCISISMSKSRFVPYVCDYIDTSMSHAHDYADVHAHAYASLPLCPHVAHDVS